MITTHQMFSSLPRELFSLIFTHIDRNSLLRFGATCVAHHRYVNQYFLHWAQELIKNDTYFALLPTEQVVRYLKRARVQITFEGSTSKEVEMFWKKLIPHYSDVPRFLSGTIVPYKKDICIEGLRSCISLLTGELPHTIQVESYQGSWAYLTRDKRVIVHPSQRECEGRYRKIVNNCALTLEGRIQEIYPNKHNMYPFSRYWLWTGVCRSLPLVKDFDQCVMNLSCHLCHNISYITQDDQAWRWITNEAQPELLMENAKKVFVMEDETFVLTHKGQLYWFVERKSKLLSENVIDIIRKRPKYTGDSYTLLTITKDHNLWYRSYGDDDSPTPHISPRLSDRTWLCENCYLTVTY